MLPTMSSTRLFQAADVVAMTGLTRSQLREWTGRDRRNLIMPDVVGDGPGRHTLFTWQTTLSLRILKCLHEEYAVEVGAWAPAISHFRDGLVGISFPSLWGAFVHFATRNRGELVFCSSATPMLGLTIELDPHLEAVTTRLSQTRPDQLFLFPAVAAK